jgi:DNA polymerase-3 subunit delta
LSKQKSDISADSILRDLKQGKYAPVYFLQGEEPYYLDLISEYIEKNCLQEHEKGFNQTVLYGKDANVGMILQYARKFPMMAERQVVIIKEAQEVGDLWKEQNESILEAYLKNPLPSTILVFCHKYKTVDGRKKISKTIGEYAVMLTTKKLYDNQVPAWVNEYFTQKGFKITPKAAQMMADYIGNDLSRQANESDKLLINLKENTAVDEALIEKYVGISKEYNVFELQNALGKKDILKANRIVQYFESNPKTNPIIPILGALNSYFMKLLVGHASPDKSDPALAKQMGVSPFFVKDYTAAMKFYPPHHLIHIIHFLREADLRSKGIDSGEMTEGQILKELTYKILHG